jgi:18S rRNA (guanine1575-N7)-methyltransferase
VSPKKNPPEKEYSDPRDYFEGEVLTSYVRSKSMMNIQEQLVLRALQLSGAQSPGLVLDLGMGAGFSSVPLYLKGFTVIGVELIWDMLAEYEIPELNPIASNMLNLMFRDNTFDFVFSVSAFQWAISNKGIINKSALISMAQNLYRILKGNGSCVFQVYESSQSLLEKVYSIFIENGFSGKYVIDNPQSKKKKKTYLILNKK